VGLVFPNNVESLSIRHWPWSVPTSSNDDASAFSSSAPLMSAGFSLDHQFLENCGLSLDFIELPQLLKSKLHWSLEAECLEFFLDGTIFGIWKFHSSRSMILWAVRPEGSIGRRSALEYRIDRIQAPSLHVYSPSGAGQGRALNAFHLPRVPNLRESSHRRG